jgi:RNA polymerase sigma factor (sigma-70 family)
MPDYLPQPDRPTGLEGVPESSSDHSLVRRLGEGSETAADRLYRRYAARLRALAKRKLPSDVSPRVDPDDVVQSVFRRFFDAARQGTYTAPTGEDLWNLLLVIALNRLRTLKTRHRAAKRDSRRTVQPEQDLAGLDATNGACERQPAAILRLVVEEAISRLPAGYQEVIELRVEGYDVAAIAHQTGRSKRTVERILQESRKALHDFLSEDE